MQNWLNYFSSNFGLFFGCSAGSKFGFGEQKKICSWFELFREVRILVATEANRFKPALCMFGRGRLKFGISKFGGGSKFGKAKFGPHLDLMSYKVHFFCSAILKERLLYTMFSGTFPMWYADISRNYGPLRQYFSPQCSISA